MDCLDLNKVTCRICITGDELITGDQLDDGLSNLFTKTINESSADATKLIDDEYVLNLRLSEALESFTCIEVGSPVIYITLIFLIKNSCSTQRMRMNAQGSFRWSHCG